MDGVGRHTTGLTARALRALGAIDGLTVYGPATADRRTPLVAFNIAGRSPFAVAEALDVHGIESRAGCHCATLAHRQLALDPPATCRLSFYVYNSVDDIDRATQAVAEIARCGAPALAVSRARS
jgi:cysteine desulfurase/selenocysteine lyase